MQINRYGEKTAESKLNKLRGIMSKIRLTRISINSRRVTHVKIDRYGNEIDEYSHNKYGFYLIIFLLNTSQMCLFSRHVNPPNESRLGEIQQHQSSP